MFALDQLVGQRIRNSLAAVSTVEAVRAVIRQSDELKQLKAGIASEAISESDIREFVSKLLSHLRAGEAFQFEGALAAIAIALESYPTEFASSYLEDLSRLDIAEIQIAPRIARQSLELQRSLADVTYRKFELGQIADDRMIVDPQRGGIGSGYSEQAFDLRVA